MLARPTGQGRVTLWEIDKVAKVGAVETPVDSVDYVDETVRRELLAAVFARSVAPHPKDDDAAPLPLILLVHLAPKLPPRDAGQII